MLAKLVVDATDKGSVIFAKLGALQRAEPLPEKKKTASFSKSTVS
jgi:hypothetical protein